MEEFATRTELRLDDRGLNGDDFHCMVKWMPALESLHLRSCEFPAASLEHLTGLKDLSSLSLQFFDLKDEDMPKLSKLKGLKSLDLRGCYNDLTDKGLEALAGLTQLERLSLRACHAVKGPGLRHLVPLKHLKELDLGGARWVMVSRMPALTTWARWPPWRSSAFAIARSFRPRAWTSSRG